MKFLIIILALSISTFSAMAATEGENQKSECIYADQSGRDAKEQIPTESAPAPQAGNDGQSV